MSEQRNLTVSNELLDLYETVQMIDNSGIISNVADLSYPPKGGLRNNEMCFYRLKQLSYDEEYPRREAFENVLLSMNNQAFNFVYVLTGMEEGIELSIGVVQNQNENELVLGKKLSAANYGEIVANVFEGNFNGSVLEKMYNTELDKLVGSGLNKYRNAGVILGIPSINEKENGEKYDFQGIDRLVNSMLGLEWRLVIVCEPVPKQEIFELREDIYELYNRLSLYAKRSVQQSLNDGVNLSFGKNHSESNGTNTGHSRTKGTSKDKHGQHWAEGSHQDEQHSEGKNWGTSDGENAGVSINRGSSVSVTVEIANKHAEELMKYIDEELLGRLKQGYSKGLFKTSVYYMAKEPTHANRLKAGIMSLFQGNRSGYSPMFAQSIDLSREGNLSILKTYQNQYMHRNRFSDDALLLLGRPYDGFRMGLNTYMTASEVSLIAGLPQKEVPGLTLIEGVEYGLNLDEENIDRATAIDLGVMVQRGRDLRKIPFHLSRDSMAKHTLIVGVTGSGKTTTCHRLLSEAKMPFLVIEPAKTEYRTLIRSEKDMVVFTLGNESVAPFRINPFELIRGEVISAHVDMLKATFTSAFPMEASMPQLLEEAIYRVYQKKGWNIDTNENEEYGDRAFDPDVNSFPILSDLLQEMSGVVEGKHFSAQMQADYIGSLVSRLSNLTVGSKGSMINCEHSIDFSYIAHHNVILEMEELKSPEDKALFMGFVLSRLSAVIKAEHRRNPGYRHLTLIEEAHRLLSKVEYGDSGSKKAAVETFTDLLAEVRKYGEGLIIVDQIPNKLTSEVIKNTNTKIIHKILAKDDKEVIGDTMLMDDKQKEYLSALRVGHAVVFSEQTDKPVHVHITPVSNTSEKQVEDVLVRERFLETLERTDSGGRGVLGGCYDYLPIAALVPMFTEVSISVGNANPDMEKYKRLQSKLRKAAENYGLTETEAWTKLITRLDNVTGRGTAGEWTQEKRVALLLDFYENVISRPDFTCEDIKIEVYQSSHYEPRKKED